MTLIEFVELLKDVIEATGGLDAPRIVIDDIEYGLIDIVDIDVSREPGGKVGNLTEMHQVFVIHTERS